MLFFLTFLSNPNPFSFTVLSRACPKSSSSNIATTFNVDFLDYYIDFLGYLQDRKARYEQSSDKRAFSLRETLVLRSRRTRTNLSHFHICSQIGQGGYGQVFLAKKRDTGEVCAVKQMSKAVLEQKGEINHILTERQILAVASSSPWLVKLLYAFQSIDHVYLAMEFVPGGDFRTLLVSSGVLKEPYAKLYFAEMSMAVFELHKLGFIHRDLKPENFLLDSQGHIKLTDFGLSRGSLSSNALQGLRKRLDKIKNAPFVCSADRFPRTLRRELRAFSLVGSPDYMAPEVLDDNAAGYDHSVDYWSLGCILFEMLSGYPPFSDPDSDTVWRNLYHWHKVLKRPHYEGVDQEFNLPDNGWDLITRLINFASVRFKTPTQIAKHPFLSEIDMDNLRNMTPPLVPNLLSDIDTSYFDDFSDPNQMKGYSQIKLRFRADSKLSAAPSRSAFVGFTFKHRLPMNY